MRKGLKMRKLGTKIMLWYLMFAFLPMVLIMTYVYFYSSQLITAGLNRNLDHEVERMGKELDEKTGDYYMISDMLYTDETLWNYLTADYSEMGFEDLYLYVDSLFTNIRMLYPDIESLSIYSTNHTLPRDEHYFYVVEETSINKKFPQIGGIMYMEKGSEGDLSFSRFMNRYETGIFRNFLTMRVREEEIRSILETGETGFCVMLADETGTVQLSESEGTSGKTDRGAGFGETGSKEEDDRALRGADRICKPSAVPSAGKAGGSQDIMRICSLRGNGICGDSTLEQRLSERC